MNYFLTGISGFIGSNLARRLAEEGHAVHAVIRNPKADAVSDLRNIHLFRGDLHDRRVLREAMEGCETVFHLAAFAKPWAKDPGEYYRINVEGAVNVFEAALAGSVQKVVFTSSAATMSPSEGNEPVNESAQRTIPYFNEYEATKAEAERRSRTYCDMGLNVVVVNPSRVYGPGPLNPSNSVTKMIAGYRNGSWRIIPGDGRKMGNYVFIDDVVRGHILAAQNGRAGERYILGGENITFDVLFQILEEVTGIKRRMVHLPLAVMTSAAKFMEWQNPLTGIPPAITAGFVRKYMNNWSLSSEKAIRELGYRATPFKAGVERTLEWLNNKIAKW